MNESGPLKVGALFGALITSFVLWTSFDLAAVAQVEGEATPGPPQAGAPPNVYTTAGAMRGQMLFVEMGCSGCHGRGADGGVFLQNYAPGTVPALSGLANRLGVVRPERARHAILLLESQIPLESLADDPPFEGYDEFLAELERVRITITNGRHTDSVVVDGEDPVDMPAWGGALEPADVDALIAYFISRYR